MPLNAVGPVMLRRGVAGQLYRARCPAIPRPIAGHRSGDARSRQRGFMRLEEEYSQQR